MVMEGSERNQAFDIFETEDMMKVDFDVKDNPFGRIRDLIRMEWEEKEKMPVLRKLKEQPQRETAQGDQTPGVSMLNSPETANLKRTPRNGGPSRGQALYSRERLHTIPFERR